VRLQSDYMQRIAGLALSYLVLAAVAGFYFIRAANLGQLSTYSVTSIFNNAMPLVLVAVGQTIVVLTRGIDLSVGAVVSITNSLAAVTMHDSALSMAGWCIVVCLVGCLAGAFNGVFVAFGRLQPIVVTLATLSIGIGVALFVLAQPGGQIPPGFTSVLTGTIGGVVPRSAIALAIVVIAWLTFRRTRLAVALYAVGNDERSARANGVPVKSTKIAAYLLCGLFAALAGLYLSAVTSTGDPNAGTDYTLTSIAAVVLGGVSLFGGKGSALGSMAGALVLTLMVNGLFLAGVNPWLQDFFQGLILILALAVNAGLARLLAGPTTRPGTSY
jgi:ribose transport system permease protein